MTCSKGCRADMDSYDETYRQGKRALRSFSLRRIQEEVRDWSAHNFPDRPAWMPLVGIMEELGELAHSFLKRHEGIRGTPEEHIANEKDAAADIVIFLIDFCNAGGYDLESLVEEVWEKVRLRDWAAERAKTGQEMLSGEEIKS